MLSSKAAASEEARRTSQYVEPLSNARTPPEDFFSILLNRCQRFSLLMNGKERGKPILSPS